MPILTINGRPQPEPEVPGAIERRNRLFMECARRLADDPLAHPAAIGRPIGDGLGMEGLVAKVAPLFARERSLIRWVALRGAFTALFIWTLDPTSAAVSPAMLPEVMGLEWVPDAKGGLDLNLAQSWHAALSLKQQEAAFGLAMSVLTRAWDYERYSKMNMQDVNADPRCRIIDPVALDSITWSAVALLRLEIAQQLFPQTPEPDAQPAPGWYTEPLFAKAQRFWDGSDWTDRCRKNDGHQFIEFDMPLA